VSHSNTSKRKVVKDILIELKKHNRNVKKNIFRSQPAYARNTCLKRRICLYRSLSGNIADPGGYSAAVREVQVRQGPKWRGNVDIVMSVLYTERRFHMNGRSINGKCRRQ
jgi:hypothetical protein